jgi:hypothetical protein
MFCSMGNVCRILFMMLFALPTWSAAQSIAVKAGDRIRFSLAGSDSLHDATLARLTTDSLYLESCATCARPLYPRADVRRLAVFRRTGSGSRVVAGFGWGGLIGLGVGAIGAANCHGGDRCDGSIVAIPVAALGGGLIGSVYGYLSAYRWQPVN